MATGDLLDRFVDLFNANRFEEGEQDYAPDAIIEELGTNRRLTVKEGTQNAREWRNAFPDARGTITNKMVDGTKGAAEIVWRGTNEGPLMGMPATRKSVTVRAVVVIETNGSKITRSAHYIDVAGMMAQLGVTPAAQAAR
jgi:steroid delta-isomerase-like uncharacterized protein